MSDFNRKAVSKFVRVIEILLVLLLGASIIGFLSFGNLYGIFWAVVTGVITIGVVKRKRWAYFSCAAWGLACYQLAKQEYEFLDVRGYAMLLGFLVIVAAIFLHEKLARKAIDADLEDKDGK
jgi:hypothetical protein